MVIVSHSVFKEQKKHQRFFPAHRTELSRWSGEKPTQIASAGQPLFSVFFQNKFSLEIRCS